MIALKTMFERLERIVLSLFVALMAILLFWSPILVLISSSIFIGILFIKYFKSKPKADHQLRPKPRPKTSQLMTIDNRFGLNPNVRHIKAARRHLPFQTTNVDNYVSNYLTNPLNTNYFLQSDGLLGSMGEQSSAPARGPTPIDAMFSAPTYRPMKESPISQLGNIPYVKLAASGVAEPITHELKLKTQSERPVTVRIAPMPQNMSKYTLNRISSMNSSQESIYAPNAYTMRTTTQTNSKSIAEALKRKRGQKPESETEDSIKVSTNKKAKRDSLNVPIVANGLIPNSSPNKKSIKRPPVDGTAILHKRFKNNEIFSSYSSMKTPQTLSQTMKTKRKLTPDLVDTTEVKTRRGLLEDESRDMSAEPKTLSSETPICLTNNSLTEITVEVEENVSKKSFEIPVNLHSMADHERDRNKARSRLNRYLNAVKEVTSPKNDTKCVQITREEPIISSEIGLPSVPAAAIFTNSRIETNVTTTLLNTPISSVLTTSPSRDTLSLPKITADNSENCSMTSAPNSPEVSVPVTTFLSTTPALTSVVSASATTTTTATNNISFNFNANLSSAIKPTPGALGLTTSNNIFNGMGNTSTPTAPIPSTSSTSSTLSVPQFSSSTPISIPNFTQLGGNSGNPFTASAPAFTNPQPNAYSSDSASNPLFSMGTGVVSTRRTAQSSRLRSRQKR